METLEDLQKELAESRRENDALQQTVAELLGLKDIASKIASTRETNEILRVLVDAVRDVVKTDDIMLSLLEEGQVEYRVRRKSEETRVIRRKGPGMMLKNEIIQWIIKERKPTAIPIGDDHLLTVVPLLVRSEVVGFLYIDSPSGEETLSPQVIEQVTLLSNVAAGALYSARLLHHLQEQHRVVASTLNYLRDVVESIHNGILTIDPDGRIAQVNRNALLMLDASGDVVGKPYGEAFPPETHSWLGAMLEETHQNGFAIERHVTVKLPHAHDLPLAVATSLLRDDQLAVKGTIVVLRDMTASKELERLRRLDQMKSEFVHNVSHELRTPLTSIKAYGEALVDFVSGDETALKFLKVIDGEADRLISLIEDLLNVARIESGKLQLNLAMHPATALVEEVLHLSKVQSTRHQLVKEFAPDLPMLYVDKEKLKEVAINLISNAIKYSPNGGEVRLKLRVEEQNLRLDVVDQGMGIAPEHLPHIGEQFFRVDSSLTYKVSGTGLGLAIVKSIIEAHDGVMKVESEVGKGSTFTMLLPIRKEPKGGTDLLKFRE
ncbi:MAG: PAS domain-containing protein [Planctomycetes bacterium]|nr:PAS domain-containing protein [Planctomycetota bacterium]